MILKYVTTRPTMTAEDLSTYTKELVDKFSREGLQRVEVLAIPATSLTKVKDVAKAITSTSLVNALPPLEQAEFTASFKKVFKDLHPDAPVLSVRQNNEQKGQKEPMSMVFMFLTVEKDKGALL